MGISYIVQSWIPSVLKISTGQQRNASIKQFCTKTLLATVLWVILRFAFAISTVLSGVCFGHYCMVAILHIHTLTWWSDFESSNCIKVVGPYQARADPVGC